MAYPEDIAHLLRLYDPTHGGGPMAPNSHINFQDFQHQLMLKTELNIWTGQRNQVIEVPTFYNENKRRLQTNSTIKQIYATT